MTAGSQPPFLSIIIPARNEEHRLLLTLQKVTTYLANQPYASEVLVVDDGSTDGTAALVQGFTSQSERPLRLLQTEAAGKGHAIRTGMVAAEGRYRFMCDADLAMPIHEITSFFPPALMGVDVAIGSREGEGAQRFNESVFTHLRGRIFNRVVQLLLVPGVKDTQCGFKCFTAAAAESLFTRQRLNGFAFDVEVLFLARRLGMRIQEIPITWVHDTRTSVRSLRQSLDMFKDVLRVRWEAWRGRYKV
jgi:dolichyl-phosphate beta-glucosyltransferase